MVLVCISPTLGDKEHLARLGHWDIFFGEMPVASLRPFLIRWFFRRAVQVLLVFGVSP